MRKGLDRQLNVVVGARFERVVADARIDAAHEQHGLRHDLVQLHRVMTGAAGHAEQRDAERVDRLLPALLPGRVARRSGGAHRLLERVAHAAALADVGQRGQHVVDHRIALRVVGCANVEAELAVARHHVDGAIRHLQHADGGDRVAVLAGALLDEKDKFGHGRCRIATPVHRRGAGVAGHADHFAHVAHAAVDRGHDAERQIELVQHRPLLDVHLDEAQVLARIALDLRDVFGFQACVRHRRTHGHAIGVLLVEPGRIEVPDERARAQERRLVALAFFLCEADDLEGERQAPVLLFQFAHAGHRHEDAEPSVVLAAVAHGVVVRAGEQGLGAGRGRFVAADHVADRVDLDRVEAAVAHALRDLRSAGAVRVGQVRHCQLAELGIAGVGMHRQRFLPVPDLVAERRHVAELVVEPNLRDAMDVAQRLALFERRMVMHATLEGVDDLALAEPRAARPAHRQDEREAELLAVGRVQAPDVRELFGRAVGQPGLALLVGRFGGERVALHLLAGEFGVHANQRELLIGGGTGHGVRHRVLQVLQRAEWPCLQCLLCHPGRVFVDAVEQGDGLCRRRGVQLVDGECHVRLQWWTWARSRERTGAPASSAARCRRGGRSRRARVLARSPESV